SEGGRAGGSLRQHQRVVRLGGGRQPVRGQSQRRRVAGPTGDHVPRGGRSPQRKCLVARLSRPALSGGRGERGAGQQDDQGGQRGGEPAQAAGGVPVGFGTGRVGAQARVEEIALASIEQAAGLRRRLNRRERVLGAQGV